MPIAFIFGSITVTAEPNNWSDIFWSAFRSYAPAPASEITGKPPIQFPFSRGDVVRCHPPCVSAIKGSNLAGHCNTPIVGRVVGIMFGREWNQSKGKHQLRRFVLMHLLCTEGNSTTPSTTSHVLGMQQVWRPCPCPLSPLPVFE